MIPKTFVYVQGSGNGLRRTGRTAPGGVGRGGGGGSDKYRILINLHMMNSLYNVSRPRAQVQDRREGYAKLYFLTLIFKFNASIPSKMQF